VLACTHYPLLLDRLTKLAPWPVNYIDPAPAIARRVVDLLGPAPAGARPGSSRATFTSGHAPHEVLARFGIAPQSAAVAGAG
jgi:glutamate racemase